MPVTHTNRKGKTYYLHQGMSKKGNPNWRWKQKRTGHSNQSFFVKNASPSYFPNPTGIYTSAVFSPTAYNPGAQIDVEKAPPSR